MKITIPPAIEAELLSIFDKCLEAESGIVFYPCLLKRATYLKRMGEAIKTESTIAAVKMADEFDEAPFLGSYSHIRLLSADEGLYAARTKEPALNYNQLILIAAYAGKSFTLDCSNEHDAKRRLAQLKTALYRLRIKYDSDIELLQVQINIPPEAPSAVRISPAAYTKNAIKEVSTEKVNEIIDRMSSAESIDDPDDFLTEDC